MPEAKLLAFVVSVVADAARTRPKTTQPQPRPAPRKTSQPHKSPRPEPRDGAADSHFGESAYQVGTANIGARVRAYVPRKA